MAAPAPELSVVIPALNEARALPQLLGDLKTLSTPHEVLIADGGSTDGTVEVAHAAGCAVIMGKPGRGLQLQAGVAASRGRWLLILHADVRLSPDALNEAEALVRAGDPERYGIWPLALAAPGRWMRLVEWGAALRWRWLGLAYGDQGLVISRELYEKAGGYPNVPIMEDVALIRALRSRGRSVRFSASVKADPRRYLREGQVRRWAGNVALILLYSAGVSPVRLARWYQPEPSGR